MADAIGEFHEALDTPGVKLFAGANGRTQLGYFDAHGQCAQPLFEFEPEGGNYRITRYPAPSGPFSLDGGKVAVT